MRTLTGALLLLTAEQAFSHAHLIGFPHVQFVREVLLPASAICAVLGLGFLIWGLFTDHPPSSSTNKSDENSSQVQK